MMDYTLELQRLKNSLEMQHTEMSATVCRIKIFLDAVNYALSALQDLEELKQLQAGRFSRVVELDIDIKQLIADQEKRGIVLGLADENKNMTANIPKEIPLSMGVVDFLREHENKIKPHLKDKT